MPTPADLPGQVSIKRSTESFGRDYDVAVRDGRIWIRRRAQEGAWRLLPPDGRPSIGGEAPDRVASVSADGDNLIAAADDGHVYYAKFEPYTEEGAFEWIDEFGLLWMVDTVRLPEGVRAYAISHRSFDVGYYEDIDGNRFEASVGVSTLYTLSADGQTIRYADPWLEPDWSHVFFTPKRGRFVALNLSVSASTLFVIDAQGEMWTRLTDYDTSGENPIPGWYSYERAFRDGDNVRTLPGWGWERQPDVEGRITSAITILQNGEGNAARELRVAGFGPKGRPGYFSKPIAAETWTFVPVGGLVLREEDVLVSAADPAAPPVGKRLGPTLDRDLVGQLTGPGGGTFPVRVTCFHPLNSPARVDVDLGGGEIFRMKLHMRRVHPDGDGGFETGLAMLEALPESLAAAGAPRRFFVEVLREQPLIEADLELDAAGHLMVDEDGLFGGVVLDVRSTP
ncbi:MAG: hypothetical protein ACYS22_05590 [Planctomycetota bacterium]